jgi:spoIIIJ-associated protein
MNEFHDQIESTLKEILDTAAIPYSGIHKSEVAGQLIFSIQAEDGRTLIGAHGDTVHALDHLVKKILEKKVPPGAGQTEEKEDSLHFLIDVNDYRTKQIKDLQNKALMLAERARSFQYDVELTPMTAYERLIVHTTLQNQPNVKTESQGEGRNRRVVIKYSAQ